jgi:poly(A) polymerase
MTEQKPRIIPRDEHIISRSDIDPDALKVLYGLSQQGFESYLVGGSVRDLLLKQKPKDFDVATDARPRQVKKLFKNCWLIGRRFRLAHVKFAGEPEKIVEVATFRAATSEKPKPKEEEGADKEGADKEGEDKEDVETVEVEMLADDNTFGSASEDAIRRDFTINALFYNIKDFSVIDYVGGVDDIEKKVLRSIGDPRVRYVEDPVRMLRALRYSRRLGFSIAKDDEAALREHADLLKEVPYSRTTEEIHKMFATGQSEEIYRGLKEFDLVAPMAPGLDKMLDDKNCYLVLKQLDALLTEAQPPGKPELWSALIDECHESLGASFKGPVDLRNQSRIHVALENMNVSKRDREIACQLLTTLTQMKNTGPMKERLFRRSHFPMSLRLYRWRLERHPEEQENFNKWWEKAEKMGVTEIQELPSRPAKRRRKRRTRNRRNPSGSH